MDQTQQNQTEAPQTGTPVGTPPEEKSVGALIGSIIIVVIIVIGGIYFWASQEPAPLPIDPAIDNVLVPDQQTEILLNQGVSDEISDIEADLNATNLDNLDAEMGDINTQLQ